MRTRIYVSGPISRGCLQSNIDQAREAGMVLLKAGYAPLVPHLTCFMAGNHPTASGGGIAHDVWLESDLAWVATADAVLRLPGESVGADRETKYARSLGTPVFDSMASLLSTLPARSPVHTGSMQYGDKMFRVIGWPMPILQQFFGVKVDADAEKMAADLERQLDLWYRKFCGKPDSPPRPVAMPQLVALAGVAGAGKDEAAKYFASIGYKRHNFGDIIKRQIDDLVKRHFGFSAFSEDRDHKKRIRRTLENWGEDNYQAIFDEYFAGLKPPAVNTRLVRVAEAQEWRRRGGVIVEIIRPGLKAATEWEREHLASLINGGWIDASVVNDSTPADLHRGLVNVLSSLKPRKGAV